MNKERELLKECRLILDTPFNGSTGINLRNRIAELLTQPEQTEQFPLPGERLIEMWRDGYDAGVRLAQSKQEPMAWCQMVEGKVQDLLTSFEMKDWLYDKSWIPLYTAPPKREPLSDGTTADMYHANKKATHPDSYWIGVYDAEKAHGIGSDDA